MKENNESEYIYIILIKAMTGIGKFARKLTKYDYTHIAISLDDSLTDFISFSRRNHYAALDSGIMHEYRSCFAFGNIEEFGAKVFKLPVSKEKKENIIKFIYDLENDTDYLFNLFSMLTMPVFHGFRIYKTHNCMSFVGLIIKKTESVEMKRMYFKYSIAELDNLMIDYLFFEGNLKKDDKIIENYMVKPNFFYKTMISTKTVFKLFGRLFRNSNEELMR